MLLSAVNHYKGRDTGPVRVGIVGGWGGGQRSTGRTR
jgi:hypothetical protein